jgi:hypothetical protein
MEMSFVGMKIVSGVLPGIYMVGLCVGWYILSLDVTPGSEIEFVLLMTTLGASVEFRI